MENKRLVFEFSWEGTPEFDNIGDTIVTIELKAIGEQTLFTLRHEGFRVEKAAHEHTIGWGECIAALEDEFAS